VLIINALFVNPLTVLSETRSANGSLSVEKTRLLSGEILVVLTNLDEGITGVSGKIFIAASPIKVWMVLTDYNNHKNFIPKLVDSGLISDNGAEQVMFQKGKTTIVIFSKTVYVKLRVHGEYLKHLDFQEITGDFKVYHGRWRLEYDPQNQGTFLSYESEIKPDFFAPAFVVRYVQRHDFPMVLAAMKARAESLTEPVSR
jgi:ribosome-associated toxin RatA of RatAB toxin-antitoxin module